MSKSRFPTKPNPNPDITFFNTLSRKKETFVPNEPGKVKLYTCGPTVYHFAHIGNLRTYIFEDILKKTLQHAGYDVKHVMNFTDVGHLQSDADEGQDKMALAAQREEKAPWVIARFYEAAFTVDCKQLRIDPPTIACRATEHLDDITQCIETLVNKSVTYTVDGNVYFDVNTFSNYNNLAQANVKKNKDKRGEIPADEEKNYGRVQADSRKQNQADFVLWFSQSKYPNQIMKWNSPWGTGFPGWHIECSAMAMKYLGAKIDIHCGGIDHIPVHHTNEIAQSETITGGKWVNYWLHGNFLTLEDEEAKSDKMSKSSGQFITLSTLTDINIQPEHFRYFCLQGHYRNTLAFSFFRLKKAADEFERLKSQVYTIKQNLLSEDIHEIKEHRDLAENLSVAFWSRLYNDLDTKNALQALWDVIRNPSLSNQCKLNLLCEFDQVLSLGINEMHTPELTPEVQELIDSRMQLRAAGLYAASDEIRDKLAQEKHLVIEDTPKGPLLIPRKPIDWTRVPSFHNEKPKTRITSVDSLAVKDTHNAPANQDQPMPAPV